LTVNREALIDLNQAINKYLVATSEDVSVVEMSKQGDECDWDCDCEQCQAEAGLGGAGVPTEQPESWHVDPPEEEWSEEEDVDLGWHQVEIGPETSTNELPPSMKPREPLGLKYWLDAVPVAHTPEESESILEAIKRRQSENWSTKPDWQYGDSI